MPRRARFSVDLPSPKLLAENDSNYAGSDSELELDDYNSFLPRRSVAHSRSASVAQISWKAMPHKGQLTILCLARFADVFQMACLQAVMFHQIKSYSPKASDADIAKHVGILQGVFMGAQSISGLLWGKIADAPWGGRKRVLLAGFMGTGISCVGLAFAQSFFTAVLWRLIAGAVNGTFSTTRTVVAETVEKKYHSHAFALLPLAFNMAHIFAPAMGGVLVDPVNNLKKLFGPKSPFGGKSGVVWMQTYPFALPSMLSAAVLFAASIIVYLGLVETLPSRRYARDTGIELVAMVRRMMPWLTRRKRVHYSRLSVNDALIFEAPSSPTAGTFAKADGHSMDHPSLSFRDIVTPKVILTLFVTGICHFHLGAYASLWPTFLATIHYDSSKSPTPQDLPFVFTGGLSFLSQTIGLTLAVSGLFGFGLQLLLWSRADKTSEAAKSFRYALLLFPVAYFLTPYLALVSTGYESPLWLGIGSILLLQVTAQAFTLPKSMALVEESAPNPSTLGIVQRIGYCTAAFSSAIGSIVGAKWYATGLQNGVVGIAWWMMTATSMAGCISSLRIK